MVQRLLNCFDALRIIFTAIVLLLITYALPSFAGQLSVGDKACLDIFGKLLVRGFLLPNL